MSALSVRRLLPSLLATLLLVAPVMEAVADHSNRGGDRRQGFATSRDNTRGFRSHPRTFRGPDDSRGSRERSRRFDHGAGAARHGAGITRERSYRRGGRRGGHGTYDHYQGRSRFGSGSDRRGR